MPEADTSIESDRRILLSICIATFNRAAFIAETLDSIVGQLSDDVELIIVDGASPDRTPEVMAEYCSRHPEVRYMRQQKNSGVDGDYDNAVGYARGAYCWLMTDDDLLAPGAVAKVCSLLDQGFDLVLANARVYNNDYTKVLRPKILDFKEDRVYDELNEEKFFSDTGDYLTFIGGVIVRRHLWQERDRKSYYGSLFIHVGVLFQRPLRKVHVIADPLVLIRYGNGIWTARRFEIWGFKWPQLIWSFDRFSDKAKSLITPREPYRSWKSLIWFRSFGVYSLKQYREHAADLNHMSAYIIALIPSVLLNAVMCLFTVLLGRKERMIVFDLAVANSSNWVTRKVAKMIGV